MTVREFRVAGSEPDTIKRLGPYSAMCESNGADVIWSGLKGLCGAQRKTVTDLIASVRDDRLGKELQQLKGLAHRFLVIEGTAQWTQTGEFQSQHIRWSMKQQWGVELSCQLSGVMLLRTRTALETVDCCNYLYDWTQADRDISSLLSRGNGKTNSWGKIDDRATAIHVWSSLPAVGPERAKRIWDKGIRLLVCGTTVEELVTVDGIGKKTAEAIVKSISGKSVVREGGET